MNAVSRGGYEPTAVPMCLGRGRSCCISWQSWKGKLHSQDMAHTMVHNQDLLVMT